MTALVFNPTRKPDAIIAIFGEVTEANDRIARIEQRAHFSEGELYGLAVRCWGNGHWCSAHGKPSFYTDMADAEAKALRWVETGAAL